jgi:hypothetical protein
MIHIQYLDISKMIPTAPFTPVGVTMSQCPTRILDCRLNSIIPLFHWSLTPTGVKGAVGLIFDIVYGSLPFYGREVRLK